MTTLDDDKDKWAVWNTMQMLGGRYNEAVGAEERSTIWTAVRGLETTYRLLWGDHVPWSAGIGRITSDEDNGRAAASREPQDVEKIVDDLMNKKAQNEVKRPIQNHCLGCGRAMSICSMPDCHHCGEST